MIIVGDLHGEIKKLEKIIKKFSGEKFLFLGDYCDSFNRSDDEIIDTLRLVLETGNIILVGNHELNYYNSWGIRGYCSGYRKSLQEKIQKIFESNQKKFKFIHYDKESRTLFSHAGISMLWLNSAYPCLKNLRDLKLYLKEWSKHNPFVPPYNHPLFAVGLARCGKYICGGPLWCDWNQEFQPPPYINQIFGHTPINHITQYKNRIRCWNADCLLFADEVLEIEGKKVTIRKF